MKRAKRFILSCLQYIHTDQPSHRISISWLKTYRGSRLRSPRRRSPSSSLPERGTPTTCSTHPCITIPVTHSYLCLHIFSTFSLILEVVNLVRSGSTAITKVNSQIFLFKFCGFSSQSEKWILHKFKELLFLWALLYFLAAELLYTVMQSDRNSSKTDTFHKPTTYEPQVWTSSERIIFFARYEYGQVGVFKIKMR